MPANLLSDVFNNILVLSDENLEIFLSETQQGFRALRDSADIDNLKVLANQLQTIKDSEGINIRKRDKGAYRKMIDLIDDIHASVSELEKANQEKIVLIDVIKKFRKKNSALTELPPEKQKTHILVAKKKSEIAYEEEMLALQLELVKLQKYIQESGRKVLIIFEGRDAAGKGGNIKRFTESLNPRSAKIVALAKPTEIEKGQWYFERYINHLPNVGEMVFFDRSWYNRAGVEPVMGFVDKRNYLQFMEDVVKLEKMIVESGVTLIKFYFSVSKEEQAARFQERQTNPLKQFKLSPIDQFSQKLWDKYTVAEYENMRRTHTEYAPWTVVNSDDKEASRINAIKYLLSRFDYPQKTKKSLKLDSSIILSGKEKVKTLEKEVSKMQKLFDV